MKSGGVNSVPYQPVFVLQCGEMRFGLLGFLACFTGSWCAMRNSECKSNFGVDVSMPLEIARAGLPHFLRGLSPPHSMVGLVR